jgi:hypothetical protein
VGLRLDPNDKKSFETISPTLLPFTPYFLQEALLVGLGGSCFEKTWRSEATTQTHLTQRREDAEAQRLQHLTNRSVSLFSHD